MIDLTTILTDLSGLLPGADDPERARDDLQNPGSLPADVPTDFGTGDKT